MTIEQKKLNEFLLFIKIIMKYKINTNIKEYYRKEKEKFDLFEKTIRKA